MAKRVSNARWSQARAAHQNNLHESVRLTGSPSCLWRRCWCCHRYQNNVAGAMAARAGEAPSLLHSLLLQELCGGAVPPGQSRSEAAVPCDCSHGHLEGGFILAWGGPMGQLRSETGRWTPTAARKSAWKIQILRPSIGGAWGPCGRGPGRYMQRRSSRAPPAGAAEKRSHNRPRTRSAEVRQDSEPSGACSAFAALFRMLACAPLGRGA